MSGYFFSVQKVIARLLYKDSEHDIAGMNIFTRYLSQSKVSFPSSRHCKIDNQAVHREHSQIPSDL